MGRVIVSGAGVAGLATAYWLDRYGWEVTVVERALTPRHAGYKVDVRGAALEVLAAMGLLDAARDRATEIRHAAYVDGRGRVIARVDGDFFGGRTNGDVEILRGDLTAVLLAAVAGRIDLRLGTSLAFVDQRADWIEVGIGDRTGRVDLVIGADGVHSNVRAIAFSPTMTELVDLGHSVAAWSVPNSLGLDREEIVFAEPGRTVNIYHASRLPHANVLALFAGPRPGQPLTVAAHRRIVRAAFDGAGWRVAELLPAADQAGDLYFDRLTQTRIERWSTGRVALVGDAAYAASPASGQGTSMALVGAYVLAGELAAAHGHHEAFASYERELRPYVERNQALAAGNLRGMVLGSRRAVWAQTRMMGLLPRVPGGRRIVEPVVRAIHDAATAITLKPYAGS